MFLTANMKVRRTDGGQPTAIGVTTAVYVATDEADVSWGEDEQRVDLRVPIAALEKVTASTTPVLYLSIDGEEITVTGTVKGDATHARLVPRPWVWSRRAGGYVLPRSLRPLTRKSMVMQFKRLAAELGVAIEVEDTGAVVTEAERRENREGRLEQRLERHENAAGRAAATAEGAYAASRQISDGIPFGQPILVGHHSERGHRAALARMDRLDRKWIDNSREAERRERLADGLRHALTHPQNPVTIRNRIARNEADVRRFERTLEDHELAVSIAGKPALVAASGLRPQSDEYVDRITGEIDRLNEAIELDQQTLAAREAAGEFVTYSKATVAAGDWVRTSGRWSRVVKANKVTVAIASGHGYDYKVTYGEITDHRTAAQAAEILAAKEASA